MSKYLALILFVVLTACETNQPVVVASYDEALNVFFEQIEAFNNRDIAGLTVNLDDDFTYNFVDGTGLYTETYGKEAFGVAMTSYYEDFDTVYSQIDDLVFSGNFVSFKETVQYKNNAASAFKSTTALGVYEIRDNKIMHAWYY